MNIFILLFFTFQNYSWNQNIVKYIESRKNREINSYFPASQRLGSEEKKLLGCNRTFISEVCTEIGAWNFYEWCSALYDPPKTVQSLGPNCTFLSNSSCTSTYWPLFLITRNLVNVIIFLLSGHCRRIDLTCPFPIKKRGKKHNRHVIKILETSLPPRQNTMSFLG